MSTLDPHLLLAVRDDCQIDMDRNNTPNRGGFVGWWAEMDASVKDELDRKWIEGWPKGFAWHLHLDLLGPNKGRHGNLPKGPTLLEVWIVRGNRYFTIRWNPKFPASREWWSRRWSIDPSISSDRVSTSWLDLDSKMLKKRKLYTERSAFQSVM